MKKVSFILAAVLFISIIIFTSAWAIDNSQGGKVKVEALVEQEFLSISGKVIKFFTDHNLYEYKSLPLITKFKNTGEADLRPQGYIIIKNWFGKEIDRLPVNDIGLLVKSGQISNFKNILASSSLIGAGKYSADLVLGYGTDERLTSKIYFWIFPWKITLYAIISLIIIYLVHSKSVKRKAPMDSIQSRVRD